MSLCLTNVRCPSQILLVTLMILMGMLIQNVICLAPAPQQRPGLDWSSQHQKYDARKQLSIALRASDNNDIAGEETSTAADRTTTTSTTTEATKLSLEEKMKNWEASEEEIKSATLGGVVPGKNRTDGFDVGLYIAFPFMVVGCLIFLLFPLLVGQIDLSNVEVPTS